MRTYIRTLFNDILKKNVLVKVVFKIVNFYCNLWSNNPKSIKFTQNVPMSNLEKNKTIFFQSVTGDKIDCK